MFRITTTNNFVESDFVGKLVRYNPPVNADGEVYNSFNRNEPEETMVITAVFLNNEGGISFIGQNVGGEEDCGWIIRSMKQTIPSTDDGPEVYEVILNNTNDRKIAAIKAARYLIKGLGLKEAKELVEQAPIKVGPTMSARKAKIFRNACIDAGCSAEIRQLTNI